MKAQDIAPVACDAIVASALSIWLASYIMTGMRNIAK